MHEPSWIIDAAGEWSVDLSHMPGGTTPLTQELMTHAMPAGMRRVFAELGTPADTLDVRFVNGFIYTRLRPLLSPDKPAAKLPPKAVLKIATRLHPEMRRRNRTAAKVLESAPWTKVIDDWHHGGRAAIEAKNLALQDVDLASLGDVDVIGHVHACFEHALAQFEHHFWLHGYDLGPIGLYLYDSVPWGLSASDLLPLLEGASPSTSAPRAELVRMRAMIDDAGATPSTLDEARAVSPAVAAAIDEYLRFHGGLVFSSYDLDGVTMAERPDLVLSSILTAAEPEARDDLAATTEATRSRVPAEHRARFDVLLSQARDAMDLRDDNGPLTAEWTMGLLRRGLLELGGRLAERGCLAERDHVLELRSDEITTQLFDGGPPTAAAVAERAAQRQWLKTLDPPRRIGDPEVAPPTSVLPAPLMRMVEMVMLVISQMGMDGAARKSGLHGCGVGSHAVRGRACVAATAEEAFELLEPGDILVVASTTPAYNLVLSIAGGVVTAEGGPMSHAAVLARELGIPAVIGAAAALTDIAHGAEIEVDPVAGEVRVLSRL